MKNKNTLKNWKVITLFLVLLLAPIFVLALTLNIDYPAIPTPGGSLDLNNINTSDLVISDIIILIYSVAIWLGGVIAFVSLVYAGFLFIFSGNAPGNRSKAKGMLTNIMWGLGILLLSWIILNLINPDLTNLQDPSLSVIEQRDINFDIGDLENKLTFECVEKCKEWCDTEIGSGSLFDKCNAQCDVVGAEKGWPATCDAFGTYSCTWDNGICVETNNECTNGGAPSISCSGISNAVLCGGFIDVACDGDAVTPPFPIVCPELATCYSVCNDGNPAQAPVCLASCNNNISCEPPDTGPSCIDTEACKAGCGGGYICIGICNDSPLPECPDYSCPVPDSSNLHEGSYCAVRGSKFHNGHDITDTQGTPLYAMESGTIGSRFGWITSAGCRLWIVNTPSEQGYAYLHMGWDIDCNTAFGPDIEEGRTVYRGQLLGYMGTTYNGKANGTSPHLHLTITKPGGTEECSKNFGTGNYGAPTIDGWPLFEQAGCGFTQ